MYQKRKGNGIVALILGVIFTLLVTGILIYAIPVLTYKPTMEELQGGSSATPADGTKAKADKSAKTDKTAKAGNSKTDSEPTKTGNWNKDMRKKLSYSSVERELKRLGFKPNKKGNFKVQFTWESMPDVSGTRVATAKNKGLHSQIISDAAAYTYSNLTPEDVKAILAAKLGDTVQVHSLYDLDRETKISLVENPILLAGFLEMMKTEKLEDYKTLSEINPWIQKFLDDFYKKPLDYWVKYTGKKYKYFMKNEYLKYACGALGFLNQMELNVECLTSRRNMHLVGLGTGEKVIMSEADYQESYAVLSYTYYDKNGNVVIKIGFNLRDKRPEILAPYVPQEPSGYTPVAKPSGTPNPPAPQQPDPPTPPQQPDPPAEEDPFVELNEEEPFVERNDLEYEIDYYIPDIPNPPTPPAPVTPDDPTPPEPTPPTPPNPPIPPVNPDKPKDETEKPEDRPKDDKGPGEFEPEPKVPKSDSDDVQESQYQPQADEKGGGEHVEKKDLTPDGTRPDGDGGTTTTKQRETEGGQTTVDEWKDTDSDGTPEEFTEQKEISSDPIEEIPSEEGTSDGDNNGEFAMP